MSPAPGSLNQPRSAFTLLELLVVIAIVGLLLALTAAAIQNVRTAATRLACLSQVRQLGMAVHAYADTHQSLPAGCDKRSNSLPAGGGYVHISWQTKILPFIEQEALWREILTAYRDDYLGDSLHHARIRSQILPIFRCPTDRRTVGWIYPEWPWGITSYLGVAGTSIYYEDGLFHENIGFRFTDITDGTSNTLLIGERPSGPQGYRSAWYGQWGDNPCLVSQILGTTVISGLPDKAVGCRQPLSGFRAGRADDYCDVVHFWSQHPGGSVFAFADGHARFISYSAGDLLPQLATRAGGEVVSLN